MSIGLQSPLNVAHVADAMFTSMMMQQSTQDSSAGVIHDLKTLKTLMESIDAELKTAGMSFAEYLERVRQMRESSPNNTNQRWRFSARERAAQRVDNAVAHLCMLVQTTAKCA